MVLQPPTIDPGGISDIYGDAGGPSERAATYRQGHEWVSFGGC
jgi:hypothetical protein